MPSDIISAFEIWTEHRRDAARNRILSLQGDDDDDHENMAIKVLGNGQFDVGGRRIMFDDDGVQMLMRRRGEQEKDGWDDTKSSFTSSTGQRSQLGATWRGAMDQTMNTGFGSGTRRTMNGTGVREGRETEALRHGVGRTGKGPAPVPVGLSRAALGKLGAVTDEDKEEDEQGSDSDMSTTVEYQGRNGVDETADERQQRLRREREKRSPSVQVSQPKLTKSVKFAEKDGTRITGKEIRRKKAKGKEEKSSWMSKWRPRLTWFV